MVARKDQDQGEDEQENSLITGSQADAIANMVVRKLFEGAPNSPAKVYKRVIRGQVFFILILCVVIGGVGVIAHYETVEVLALTKEMNVVKNEKDVYTKRSELAESALAYERQERAEISKSLRLKGLELLSARYAEKLHSHYVELGTNKYNRKFSHLKKVAKAVIDVQKYFPGVGKTAKQRIGTGLAIGCIESGLNPDVIGSSKEVTMFQILPSELRRLMVKAQAREFGISSNPKEIRTSVILMYIHLEEKITNAGGDREGGIRKYNGNWRKNPSYWLNFLKYYHVLEDVEVDEVLFEDGKK